LIESFHQPIFLQQQSQTYQSTPYKNSTKNSPPIIKTRWFQDRHVRVSMLLAEGIQADDGRPLLPGCGHGLGGGTSCGGRPRIVGRVTMYCAPDQTQQRRLVVCDERTHALAALKAGPANFLCHPLPAGDNLYAYVYGRAAAAARNGDGAGAGRLGSNGSAVSVSCNDDVCGVRATFRRVRAFLLVCKWVMPL
jgi:hypothetical protein